MKTLFIILFPGVLYTLLFASLYFGETNFLLRLMGSLAFLYLSITIAISPLSEIFGKSYIVKYRKYFGITMFYFVVFHAVKYSLDALEFGHFWSLEQFQDQDVLSGTIAFFLVLPLYLTSNSFSLHFLGKHWKTLQSLIYPLYLVGAIHIAFSGSMNVWYASMIGGVVLLRIVSYILGENTSSIDDSKRLKVKRYLCVPCGFIYDPRLGDPDGGIAPGTEFEDIPDDWRCPVCGVGKSDFIEIMVDAGEEKILTESKVISCEYVTKDVIELKVEITDSDIGKNYIPGQFMIFVFADRDGNFERRYSIVSKNKNIYTFLIHPSPDGRSKKILALAKAGDILRVESIAGNFALEGNTQKKIAIATGTGIAPIIAMFQFCDPGISKKIYFGLRKKEDIFYEHILRSIPNTEVIIFLSQEETKTYQYGRISLEKNDLSNDNEFYICGNPEMVQSTQFSLREAKCDENIYFESFT